MTASSLEASDLVTEAVPAVFSPCLRYRYSLRRRVGLAPDNCLFIMLNPSTADANKDDPTIRRCMGFARRWGFGCLTVVNLFALRSVDPKALALASDPVGPDNDKWICLEVMDADRIISAWGNGGQLNGRSNEVVGLIESRCGKLTQHLGLNQSGEPKHPLYIPKAQEPTLL